MKIWNFIKPRIAQCVIGLPTVKIHQYENVVRRQHVCPRELIAIAITHDAFINFFPI